MEYTSGNSDGQFAGHINIGTHSLYTEVHGITKKSGFLERPTIVIIQGIGSTIFEWPAAIRDLAKLSQVVSYERAGFGLSQASARAPTTIQAATELNALLSSVEVPAPYIIVAHSYSGIIAREFLQLRPQSVSGVVFVDANTEETPSTYPNRYVRAMSAGLNTLEVTIGEDHALTTQEWNALLKAEEDQRNREAAAREAAYYHRSGDVLASKSKLSQLFPPLGDIPLIVLHANYARDLSAILAAGLQAGNGIEDERRGLIAFLDSCNEQEERMQRKMLALSSNAKFVHVPESGHQIHIVKPEVITEAVESLITSVN